MKFLFVNDFHVPQLYRGTEVNTHGMCQLLKRLGHAVEVVCALKPDGALGFMSRLRMKATRAAWVTDHAAGYPTHRAWHVVRVLEAVIRERRPDVVVLQSGDKEVIAAAAQLDVPILLYFHFVPDWERVPKFQNAGFLTNSLFCQAKIAEAYGLTSTVIRPIVLPEDYRTEVVGKEVTAFGMNRIKGSDIVLDLAASLPDIAFRIFANQRAIKTDERGLLERAHALPNLHVSAPLASGGRLYRHTRVVLAPSRWEETWGRMATEAHVNGIPVLASDRGGLPEAVGNGGFCLPIDAPLDAWRDILVSLFRNEAAYMRVQEAARLQQQSPLIDPAVIARDFVNAADACIRRSCPLVH